MDDRHVGNDFAHVVGDRPDGRRLVPDEVVHPRRHRLGDRGDHAFGEVFDVDELSRLHAVACDQERFAGTRSGDKRREYG